MKIFFFGFFVVVVLLLGVGLVGLGGLFCLFVLVGVVVLFVFFFNALFNVVNFFFLFRFPLFLTNTKTRDISLNRHTNYKLYQLNHSESSSISLLTSSSNDKSSSNCLAANSASC